MYSLLQIDFVRERKNVMILDIILGSINIPDSDVVEIGEKEVNPDEKVIGVVGQGPRKLWTVISRKLDILKPKVEKVRAYVETGTGDPLSQETIAEIDAEVMSIKLLKEIFWQEVREELSVTYSGIAIRKGWVLVAEKSEDPLAGLGIEIVDILRGAPVDLAGTDCGDPDCPVHGKNPIPIFSLLRGQA